MKITGIVLLVFAALNFLVGIMASSNGASGAAGQKFSAALLLAAIGGLLFYFGKQKERKKMEEEFLAKQKKEEEEKRKAALVEQQKREAERQQKLKEQREKNATEKKRMEHEANSKKYKILYFYLDCSHCHEQDKELKKCSLALPVEVVDIEEEEDTAGKYKVRSLPKLILVDYNGKEIKRWLGVTESSEINEFLYSNGYAEKKETEHYGKQELDESLLDEDDDCEDYPKPMFTLGLDDMKRLMSEEFMNKGISIAAEGGTKDQTQVKFEILLGKREKTEAMLAIEKPIREFFHKLYDDAGREAYESSDKPLLRKLAVATYMMEAYKSVNEEGGQHYAGKNKMIEIANKYGVSVNIIESEEKEKATKKYSK
ncbi:MAG: thioredoxin domain-containing protein [Alloprevotella sp.]